MLDFYSPYSTCELCQADLIETFSKICNSLIEDSLLLSVKHYAPNGMAIHIANIAHCNCL